MKEEDGKYRYQSVKILRFLTKCNQQECQHHPKQPVEDVVDSKYPQQSQKHKAALLHQTYTFCLAYKSLPNVDCLYSIQHDEEGMI